MKKIYSLSIVSHTFFKKYGLECPILFSGQYLKTPLTLPHYSKCDGKELRINRGFTRRVVEVESILSDFVESIKKDIQEIVTNNEKKYGNKVGYVWLESENNYFDFYKKELEVKDILQEIKGYLINNLETVIIDDKKSEVLNNLEIVEIESKDSRMFNNLETEVSNSLQVGIAREVIDTVIYLKDSKEEVVSEVEIDSGIDSEKAILIDEFEKDSLSSSQKINNEMYFQPNNLFNPELSFKDNILELPEEIKSFDLENKVVIDIHWIKDLMRKSLTAENPLTEKILNILQVNYGEDFVKSMNLERIIPEEEFLLSETYLLEPHYPLSELISISSSERISPEIPFSIIQEKELSKKDIVVFNIDSSKEFVNNQTVEIDLTSSPEFDKNNIFESEISENKEMSLENNLVLTVSNDIVSNKINISESIIENGRMFYKDQIEEVIPSDRFMDFANSNIHEIRGESIIEGSPHQNYNVFIPDNFLGNSLVSEIESIEDYLTQFNRIIPIEELLESKIISGDKGLVGEVYFQELLNLTPYNIRIVDVEKSKLSTKNEIYDFEILNSESFSRRESLEEFSLIDFSEFNQPSMMSELIELPSGATPILRENILYVLEDLMATRNITEKFIVDSLEEMKGRAILESVLSPLMNFTKNKKVLPIKIRKRKLSSLKNKEIITRVTDFKDMVRDNILPIVIPKQKKLLRLNNEIITELKEQKEFVINRPEIIIRKSKDSFFNRINKEILLINDSIENALRIKQVIPISIIKDVNLTEKEEESSELIWLIMGRPYFWSNWPGKKTR